MTSGRVPLALAVVAIWLVWAALDGGYWPWAWGPLGIVLLGIVALTAAAFPRDADPGRCRARLTVLALLTLFVGWSFASLTWADFPADAWEGSNKTLLYAVGFAFFGGWRWSAGAVTAVLGTFALGTAAIGVATLVQLTLAGGSETALPDGRLLGPTGYVNASVALWTAALWPACFLAASRRLALPLRAVFLGSAGLLAELALLGQSRAWLALLPAAVALALLFARARLRLLLAFALVGVATLACAPALLAVRDAAAAGDAEPELVRAALAAAASWLALVAAGAVWAAADSRLSLSARTLRLLRLAVTTLAAAAFLAGVAVAARAVDDPGAWVSARWQDFTQGAYPEDGRFSGSLASNRYQHWRIAWAEFRERPIVGNGVDNYYAEYLLRRKTPEAEPRYPHSWLLRLLSQVGLVGTALFLAAAALAVRLALDARLRLPRDDADLVAGALTVFFYWLLHGSVDWFWEMPALAAPALGLLALAGAAVDGEVDFPVRARPRSRARVAVTGVVGIVLAASLALPWLSDLQQRAGIAVWRSRPALAYERLDRAAKLDPLAGEPLLVKGSVALRRRDLPTATDALARVLEREPRNWYAHFQLALTAAVAGDYGRAETRIRRARELNPLDPVVAEAAGLIARRRPILPDELNERFSEQLARRVGG